MNDIKTKMQAIASVKNTKKSCIVLIACGIFVLFIVNAQSVVERGVLDVGLSILTVIITIVVVGILMFNKKLLRSMLLYKYCDPNSYYEVTYNVKQGEDTFRNLVTTTHASFYNGNFEKTISSGEKVLELENASPLKKCFVFYSLIMSYFLLEEYDMCKNKINDYLCLYKKKISDAEMDTIQFVLCFMDGEYKQAIDKIEEMKRTRMNLEYVVYNYLVILALKKLNETDKIIIYYCNEILKLDNITYFSKQALSLSNELSKRG